MARQYVDYKEKWNEAQITTMDEFKILIEKAAIMQIKKAEKFVEAQQAGQVSQKLQQVSKDTQTASKELGSFMDMAENLAEDEIEPTEKEELAKRQEEESIAKASLLEELGQMAAEASHSGNYKVAYKIERAIDSIIYDED